MRPKFRRNKGKCYLLSPWPGGSLLYAIWSKNLISFSASFDYAEALGYQKFSIVEDVKTGSEKKEILKKVITLANQNARAGRRLARHKKERSTWRT